MPTASNELPRMLQRDGLFGRSMPFVVTTLVALVLLFTAGPRRDGPTLLLAAAFVVALAGLVAFVPWHRWPRWTELVPPLLFFVLVAALRRHYDGVNAMVVAPFFLIPTIWVALYGTTAELSVIVGAALMARLAPGLLREYEPVELGFSLSGLFVAAAMGFIVHARVESMRAADRSMEAILDGLPIGVAVTRGGVVRHANRELERLVGRSARELSGRVAATLVGPAHRATLGLHTRGAAGPDDEHELQVERPDGGVVALRVRSVPLRFAGRAAIGLLVREPALPPEGASLDLRRTALEADRDLLRVTIENVDDGVAILDEEHRGILANRAYLELFELDAERFAGMTREEFITHAARRTDSPGDFARDFRAIGDGTSVFKFRHPRRSILKRILRPIATANGTGYLVVWRDVTAQIDLMSRAEKHAALDPLTKLLNRRGAIDVIESKLARMTASAAPLGLIMIDVDHFKTINDRLGHQVGDEVLCGIARALVGEARATDVVARWGGEEFLVVVNSGRAGARAFYERLRGALAALAIGEVGALTVSAGVVEHLEGESLEATITRADHLLYEAKRGGRDQVRE